MNELSLHFLAKMKIMVVKDIEREDIEFYSKVFLLNQCLVGAYVSSVKILGLFTSTIFFLLN